MDKQKTFMSYRKALISRRQCLIGNPPIKKESFLNLTPEDKIKKIGKGNSKGGENSGSRLDEFKVPATYKGIYQDEGNNYLVFQLPEDSVEGWDLFRPEENVYLAYTFNPDCKKEIYQSVPTEIRIYQSCFEKV